MITSDDRILITGASGFIGTNLIELFEKNGYSFVNFDISQPTKKQQTKYWVKGDIMQIQDLKDVFSKYRPTIIIHLAARTDTASTNLEDYRVNFDGTLNLLNVVKENSFVKHLIITSTQYVYKNKLVPFGLKDDDYYPHTKYGESKKMSEEIVRHGNLACKWTIVRPANVWGPWHMRYPNELFKIVDSGLYFHPCRHEVVRTYGYVKTITYQLDKILNADDCIVNKQTFYLGDMPLDSYIWLNELSMVLRHKRILHFPKLLFWGAAFIGDMLKLISFKFPLNSVRFHNMVENYYAPSNITVKQFGVYGNLTNNMEETVKWLHGEGASYFKYWNNKKNRIACADI